MVVALAFGKGGDRPFMRNVDAGVNLARKPFSHLG